MISEEKQDYLCRFICPDSSLSHVTRSSDESVCLSFLFGCQTLPSHPSYSPIFESISTIILDSKNVPPIQRHALHLHFFSSLHVAPTVSTVGCDFASASTCTRTWNQKHRGTLLLSTKQKKMNTFSLFLLLTSAIITKELCSCCFL